MRRGRDGLGLGPEKQGWVEAFLQPGERPMEVGSGGAPTGSDVPDDFAAFDLLTDLDLSAGEVDKGGLEAIAVVDEDGDSAKGEVCYEANGSIVRGDDGGSCGCGDI